MKKKEKRNKMIRKKRKRGAEGGRSCTRGRKRVGGLLRRGGWGGWGGS